MIYSLCAIEGINTSMSIILNGVRRRGKRNPKGVLMYIRDSKIIGIKNEKEDLTIRVNLHVSKGREVQVEFECLERHSNNFQRVVARSAMGSDGTVDCLVDGKFEVATDHVSVGNLTVTYRDGKMIVASDVKTHIEFVTTKDEFDLFINQVKFIIE